MEASQFEMIISFDGDANPRIKSSHQLDDVTLELIIMILKPFMGDVGARDRLINRAEFLKIKYFIKAGVLDGYTIGFTNDDKITQIHTKTQKT